ncbi:nucleoside/nucleotide kinase family protein [Rhodobacter calidifons]|uniref:Nucleoside/nucleotide kinase family protein n=1 Tax=Rhodobacter calidifons TaxID=2715277 RepID=A0ABX0G891_9RHOB|nr:nucleoside/nucleotide kinase family protein [Rhodobacter calidifons]NHB77073.1 nucleoside/nucleotide kinase family protein [Rhodobacter calidifons]
MGNLADLTQIADRLEARAAEGGRVIAALAGAPGSGKSTLADKLVGKLNGRKPGQAAVLPMDGYHYDDLYLVPAGLRPRKGAPMTFDVGGLYHTLKRLRARDEDEVAVPVFDRRIEIARAGARLIPKDVPIIVVEGNWLLLNEAPWDRLHPMFDLTVMVDVPEHVLRARLRGRWERLGLSEAEIVEKLEENDLPNGRRVRECSISADHVIRNG